MIRAVIVDDEPIARAGLRTLLGAERDVSIVAECRDGAEAVARIRSDRPDLVFLDVQMPELTGFEVLSALAPEDLPAIVFVTAYDAYALDAFEASAVDYLLKPFDRERFARALARARRFLAGDQLTVFRTRIASVLQAPSWLPGPPHLPLLHRPSCRPAELWRCPPRTRRRTPRGLDCSPAPAVAA